MLTIWYRVDVSHSELVIEGERRLGWIGGMTPETMRNLRRDRERTQPKLTFLVCCPQFVYLVPAGH